MRSLLLIICPNELGNRSDEPDRWSARQDGLKPGALPRADMRQAVGLRFQIALNDARTQSLSITLHS